MNKKIKKLLSLGIVTVLTSSSMIPINAYSKTSYKKFPTNNCSYIVVNRVNCKPQLNPNCPTKPSTPEVKPEIPDDNNSNSTSENFSDYQKEVLDLVNVERRKMGLKNLVLDSSLSQVATLKSQDMVNKNYFSHTSPTYGSPFDMMKKFGISYKTAGENIAYGQSSPKQVVADWMNSKGHRENILNPNFTHLGVGVAKDSKGTIYWTQMFIGK